MIGIPTHTFDLATFSAEGAVEGPCAQPREAALEYLAQRMADQHRGGPAATHWRAEAARLLSEAEGRPGEPRRRSVARARGVTVTALPAIAATAFRVELFPLFDDEGPAASVVCAAASHPRFPIAMREAGLRAERWLRHEAATLRAAEERGAVVGFEATIDARLLAPLRALPDPAGRVSPESVGGQELLSALSCARAGRNRKGAS